MPLLSVILATKVVYFLDFSLVFRVVDREFAHEKITWISGKASTFFLDIEVFCTLTSQPLVDDVPISEQDQSIAVGECLGTWLVNCAYNGFILLSCDVLEGAHDFDCSEAIKTRRWFI